MHRPLVILALAATVPGAPLTAQSRIAVFGGYSSVRMTAEAGDLTTISAPRQPRHGFVPGITGTLMIHHNLEITAEAMLVRKGFLRDFPTSSYNLDIRYLEFPLLLGARYPMGGGFRLQVHGGATFSIREQCSETFIQGDGSRAMTDCVDTDFGVVVPKTDIGLTAGFGLVYHRCWAVGQYELTGRNIPADAPGRNRDLQHRTLIVMLGFDLLSGGR